MNRLMSFVVFSGWMLLAGACTFDTANSVSQGNEPGQTDARVSVIDAQRTVDEADAVIEQDAALAVPKPQGTPIAMNEIGVIDEAKPVVIHSCPESMVLLGLRTTALTTTFINTPYGGFCDVALLCTDLQLTATGIVPGEEVTVVPTSMGYGSCGNGDVTTVLQTTEDVVCPANGQSRGLVTGLFTRRGGAYGSMIAIGIYCNLLDTDGQISSGTLAIQRYFTLAGTTEESTCQDSMVITGIAGRSGYVFDSARSLCQRVRPGSSM